MQSPSIQLINYNWLVDSVWRVPKGSLLTIDELVEFWFTKLFEL